MSWRFITDWKFIAMCTTIIILWLRIFLPSKYNWLWKNLQWNWKLVIPACFGVSILIIRGIILFPFSGVVLRWETLSPIWHILLYGDSIHFRSTLFFSALIILLWKKYGSMLPALAVGWFCLGSVELTFILQHWVKIPGRFLGWNWYMPFIGICLYFIVIRKCFKFPRKFWLFFAAATFVEFFALLFAPYWLTLVTQVVGTSSFTHAINLSVLPTPPIQTWIFWFLNHFMKALFIIAFYFVIKVKDDIPVENEKK